MSTRIPLSEAALRLGLTYHQVRERVFRQELVGGRDQFGRFYIDAESLPSIPNHGARSQPAA
ncbi:MAG: hypothetical protein R2910_05530 [Gemmatimonadales bacterium]